MACAQCNQSLVVMMPMQPGFDGKPWELCSRCWIDGVRRDKLGNVDPALTAEAEAEKPRGAHEPTPRTPRHAGASSRRSHAKDEVGSFSYTGGIQYVPDDDEYW